MRIGVDLGGTKTEAVALGPGGDWLRGWRVMGKDDQWYPCGVLCDRRAVDYARRRIPILDHQSPLQILEKDFAMVYWDQRHSGMSKGSADPNDSRPEDFGNDLAVVIQELQNRYTIKKIFLIGQSWGHFVATSYGWYYGDLVAILGLGLFAL